MAETVENKVPWKEGYFKMGPFSSIILETSGNNLMLWKNLVILDYPDMKIGSIPMKCHYGNFGEAKKEIAEATGVKD